jgi:hypothetical protein
MSSITFERDFSARAFADEIGAEELFRRDRVKNSQAWMDSFAGQTAIGGEQSISPNPVGEGGGGGSGSPASARFVTWTLPSGPVVAGRTLQFAQNGGSPTVYTMTGNEGLIYVVASALCTAYNQVSGKLWTLVATFNSGTNVTTITATAVTAGVAANAYSPALSFGNNSSIPALPVIRLFTLEAPTPTFGEGAHLRLSINSEEIGTIDTDDETITTLEALANAVVVAMADNSTPFDVTMTSVDDVVRLVLTGKTAGASLNSQAIQIVFIASPDGFDVVAEPVPPSQLGVDGAAANTLAQGTDTPGVDATGGGSESESVTLLCNIWIETSGDIDLFLNGEASIRCRPPTGKKGVIMLENAIIVTGESENSFTLYNPGTRDVRVNYFVCYNVL